MRNSLSLIALFAAGVLSASANSADMPSVIAAYKAAPGVGIADGNRGERFWLAQHKSAKGELLSCASCHGKDLKLSGKHHTSGKVIEPMAPSVNAERYTDTEKVEKWFKRNCKQVLLRECSAQEKVDVLLYLSKF